ncbi:MAG: FkbM family methyltransferase [Planctomycetia bacterium]|nr:FkbM family methyltransferase [Planctomycetia bacterium]
MWLLRWLPIGVLRWIAALQYRLPLVGPWLGWANQRLLAKEGVIKHGIGAGLRFDARGGNAGYLLGTSEPHEQDALGRYLLPGGVFYEIGANIGFYTTLGARLVGPKGHVVAFEPNPACVAQVKKNAGLNGFANVETVETAVASTTGRTRLYLAAVTGHSTTTPKDPNRDGIEVAVTTIDDFVRTRRPRGPTLVMIDVEGAEIEVLKGMQETLREFRPIVMCEVHWIGDAFLAYCREQIVPLGYTLEPLEGTEFPPSLTRYHAVLVPKGSPAAAAS